MESNSPQKQTFSKGREIAGEGEKNEESKGGEYG
jgi:hypothetical protein